MQAWMWRLTDDHAVIYTDDKATLKALFAYSRFPHQDLSRATTYERKNGRAFAWQFTFPVSAWNGVVRYLGRASITMLDQERWITAAELERPELPFEEPTKKGKAGAAATMIPQKKERTAAAARRSAPLPVADLTEPLHPMVSATSKAIAPKARPVATAPVAAAPVSAASARNTTPARKATASTPAAPKRREPDAEEGKRGKTELTPAAVVTATKAGKPKPVSASAHPIPVVSAPLPEPQRSSTRGKKAPIGNLRPPEELQVDASARKRAPIPDGRSSVVIDDVQRRMVAPAVRALPSDNALPVAQRGRVKAGTETAPPPGAVSKTPSVSLRTAPSLGGKRKPVAALEAALAVSSPRGGGVTVVTEPAAPASSTARQRGAKSG